jgi:hypothetical protein
MIREEAKQETSRSWWQALWHFIPEDNTLQEVIGLSLERNFFILSGSDSEASTS